MTTEAPELIPAVRFLGLFNVPGEGVVVHLEIDGEGALFDRHGLQYRIVQLWQRNLAHAVEDQALSQLNLAAPGESGS
ncbi:hypothetical protein OAS86_01700 [Gammaproteobacteria bacterium]|nr:hypothetical protein [Gammaproteobacteria bacterium]